MPGKLHLNWTDYETMVEQLELRLKTTTNLGHLRAIPRGGLVPAVLLSHRLGIPYHGELYLGGINDRIVPINDRTLLVDDILDTGSTLIRALAHGTPAAVAVVVAKPKGIAAWHKHINNMAQSRTLPTLLIGHIYRGSAWVVFPYENQKTEAPR